MAKVHTHIWAACVCVLVLVRGDMWVSRVCMHVYVCVCVDACAHSYISRVHTHTWATNALSYKIQMHSANRHERTHTQWYRRKHKCSTSREYTHIPESCICIYVVSLCVCSFVSGRGQFAGICECTVGNLWVCMYVCVSVCVYSCLFVDICARKWQVVSLFSIRIYQIRFEQIPSNSIKQDSLKFYQTPRGS